MKKSNIQYLVKSYEKFDKGRILTLPKYFETEGQAALELFEAGKRMIRDSSLEGFTEELRRFLKQTPMNRIEIIYLTQGLNRCYNR